MTKITVVGMGHVGLANAVLLSQNNEVTALEVMEEKVDLILNIVDSTNLERSLYLTTQLLELDIPVIVVLNMSDIALQRGIRIDYQYLEEKLGVKL